MCQELSPPGDFAAAFARFAVMKEVTAGLMGMIEEHHIRVYYERRPHIDLHLLTVALLLAADDMTTEGDTDDGKQYQALPEPS